MPGLFFEASILLANPALICELVARGEDGLRIGHYAMLGIALFLAFVIGNASILFVTLIQKLFGYLYRFRGYIWEELCAWPLWPLVSWLNTKPRWARRKRFPDIYMYVQTVARGHIPLDLDARKCWALIARRLLKKKYGIKPKDIGQEEWDALYQTLGTLRIEDVRGSMAMIVFEATGWCGLAATRFAPELSKRYYVGISVLLVVAGLLHDWYVAEGLNNPRFLGFLKVRALLREFGDVAESEPGAQAATPEPGGGATS
jgi:hypothetical protein